MSIKGVVGLRLVAAEAAVAAEVIADRTATVSLDNTPLTALPSFGRKLSKSVKRQRGRATSEVLLWTVTREEADAGYTYLMMFSHEDAPPSGLSNLELDAIHNVALDLLTALLVKKGPEPLGVEQVEDRIRAWSQPEATDGEPLDKRWTARLKRRSADDRAAWNRLLAQGRPPIPEFARPLLAGRKITG